MRISQASVWGASQRVGHQCAVQRLALETDHPAAPAVAGQRHHTEQWAPPDATRYAKEAAAIDAQEGMPAHRDAVPVQPVGVQPAVGADQHGPVGRHTSPQLGEQGLPVRAPSPVRVGAHDFPGDRDRTTAVDHTDREHGEALAQRGGIHVASAESPFSWGPTT